MKFIILFIFASIVCMGMGLPQGISKCLVQCKKRINGGSYKMNMLAVADLCSVSNGEVGQKSSWESICKTEAMICSKNCKLSKIASRMMGSISFQENFNGESSTPLAGNPIDGPGQKPKPGQSYGLNYGNFEGEKSENPEKLEKPQKQIIDW